MSDDIKKIDDGTLKGDELDHAMADAQNGKGIYTHKFAEPFKFEDKTYTELTFKFKDLTTGDMIAIERQLTITEGVTVVDPALSVMFLIAMSAKAAGVGYDMIKKLPMYDGYQIRGKARNFMMRPVV